MHLFTTILDWVSVNKCIFNKHTISCFWQCPGNSAPSVVNLTVPLKGAVSAQKALQKALENQWFCTKGNRKKIELVARPAESQGKGSMSQFSTMGSNIHTKTWGTVTFLKTAGTSWLKSWAVMTTFCLIPGLSANAFLSTLPFLEVQCNSIIMGLDIETRSVKLLNN